MNLELIKENEKGRKYQADGFKILYRNAGSVSGDNDTNPKERIYLISGRAKVVIDGVEEEHEAPSEFLVQEKTHHKIEALDDICLLIFDH